MRTSVGLAALALPALLSCRSPEPPTPAYWTTGTAYPSPQGPTVRGLLDRRGLIHAHSYNSHDACDNALGNTGQRDLPCLDDFRRDLCKVQHDFVFLTDHDGSFSETEYPDAMLYKPADGDTLVTRENKPIATRLACADGHRPLVIPGTESATMAVGLEEHVAPTKAARSALYNAVDAQAIEAFRQKGAISLLQHTEDWTPEQITSLPLDGFEMYNLHANTVRAAGTALELMGRLIQNQTEGMARPDLVFLFLFSEDPIYLSTWSKSLASGARRVTTMGTDCHRNSFPQLLEDGERVDSYRRMMSWFSNHLLVRPEADGSWDDRNLKEALRAGRLYGAFEVFGTPDGFDFHSTAAGLTKEMGEEVTLADAPTLHVKAPAVRALDPSRTPPKLTTRLLRATTEGWVEVASTQGNIDFTPTRPGAYRAEVRIEPHHLRPDLRDDADRLLSHDYVWIYSNALYVR